jgi:Fe-S-cluster containining protein
MHQAKTGQQSCRRCGACCQKGGPVLHVEDRDIVEDGIIPGSRLFTVRPGEPVHENVAGKIVWADSEMIKIKGSGRHWTCDYYLKETASCRIYDHRPVECRVMKCWDTEDIETIYGQRLLTRKMLLSHMAEIWDLVEDHQHRCDYRRVRELTPKIRFGNSREDAAELEQMVRYDLAIRQLVVEQAGIEENMLDFLFGRAMTTTIVGFGFDAKRRNDSDRILICPR